MRLRIDPIWLARVEESARNLAKACDSFRQGIRDGLRQERERRFREATEEDLRTKGSWCAKCGKWRGVAPEDFVCRYCLHTEARPG